MKNITKLCLFIVLLMSSITTFAQQTISGSVTDHTNNYLPGVSVVYTGTTVGTITDFDGTYTLSGNPGSATTLTFSFIGMETVVVDIAGRSTIDVKMENGAVALDEVVAVGYGVQKKSDLTGSVVSVKADEVAKLPVSRVDQALQGKVTGVAISNDKAQPGSSPVIRIRGDNSISGDNAPLVVVDGILGADMTMLDPNEIESVEVLKDASAKAIYGSRGANGVIIITTKSGKSGKTKFSFSSYFSVSKVAKKLDLMTAKEQYDYLSNYPADGDQYVDVQALLAKYDANNPEGTDWQDVIFQNAQVQNYNLNISGGNEKTTFLVSGSFMDQNGVVKKTDYARQSLRARINHQATDKLELGVNIYLGTSTQNSTRADSPGGSSGGSITQAANRFSPMLSVYDAKGGYSLPFPESLQLNNPAALVNDRIDERKSFQATANFNINYKITDELTFVSTSTARFSNLTRNQWAGKSTLEAWGIGSSSVENTNANSWLNENTLTYDKTVGKHRFSVMGGLTASKYASPKMSAGSSTFPTEVLTYYSIQLGDPASRSVSSGISEYSMLSYLGRVNYVLAEKYLFTVNFRADGSSKFAKNNKWGYFPSAALGWRVTEEDWMKGIEQITNLKLRLSYGQTGSQAISPYQSLASYSASVVPLADGFYNGIVSKNVPNPDLKWETTEEINLGFDLGLFDNRITFIADVYEKTTKDLLYEKNLPLYTGTPYQTQNIGTLKNRGLELTLNTVNFDKAFKWSSSFNISFNANEVVDLGGDEYRLIDFSGGALGAEWRQAGILKVGESIGSFYGYVFDGIYQNQAECDALPYPEGACKPGMVKLKDLDGDGKITPDDRQIIGNGVPDVTFGISNDFSYKNFDLNIMFQGSHGADIMNLNRIKLEQASVENGLATLLTDSWTGEGSSNTIQKIGEEVGPPSSRFVENGSYVRLRNISLGYTVPTNLVNKYHISGLRFYISAQNLLTITDYSGYDPEINSREGNLSRGIDYGGYPTAKSYTFGLNLNF